MTSSENNALATEPHAPDSEGVVAVGIVATATNAEPLLRTVLRAQERGYVHIVIHDGHPETEAIRLACRAGATTIDPSVSDPDYETLQEDVTAHARTLGFKGLIFQSERCERIDFARSERRLDDDFVTAAVVEDGDGAATPTVMVGIPAYNEAATIADVVRATLDHADRVVVIDDGSTDDTARLAREAGATIVERDANRGYGTALKTLFQEGNRWGADILVIIDGDGQHDPADIPRLVAHQQDTGAEVVIGSRFTDGGDTDAPLYRRVGLSVVNALTNLSLGIVRPRSWISDTQSGFRAYDRRAIQTLADADTIGNEMGASVDIISQTAYQELGITEVGIDISYSVDNSSTRNPVRHGLMLLRNIIRTVETKQPINAFGIPGVVTALAGFGFGYWTAINYFTTGSFPYGLAIITGFLALAGIFSIFTAILLHALRLHSE